MNTRIQLKDKKGNTKLLEFNLFGTCVNIFAFTKDIAHNRLSNWERNINNKNICSYTGSNLQNFAEFILETT